MHRCNTFIQLKNFIQRASFDPTIDDNYFARSQENNNTDDDIISNKTAKYLVAFYIAGTILVAFITVMLLFIYYNTKRWDERLTRLSTLSKPNKYIQSKIFSIAMTTIVINVYTVCLDGLAVRAVIKKKSDVDRPDILSDLAYIMLATNLFTIVFWTVSCLVGICCRAKLFLCLALSTLGPTISLVIHLPYVFIAYLNDASYATSIFIYYTIIVFVLFGALDLCCGTCIGAIIKRENNERGSNMYPCFKECNVTGIITFAIIIPIFTFLIVVLVGMVTAALVVIPISSSIRDAPNRLLGFYQTVFILGGAYLVYRNFFKKTPTLESVVKDKETSIFQIGNTNQNVRWEGLSNDEKVAAFYSHLVTIVANINPSDPRIIPRLLNEQRRESQGEGDEPHQGVQQMGPEMDVGVELDDDDDDSDNEITPLVNNNI